MQKDVKIPLHIAYKTYIYTKIYENNKNIQKNKNFLKFYAKNVDNPFL